MSKGSLIVQQLKAAFFWLVKSEIIIFFENEVILEVFKLPEVEKKNASNCIFDFQRVAKNI
jgi:hypothetical protein